MKFISKKAASKAYPSKIIAYVTNEKKLCYDENGEPLISTIGLDDSRPYSRQFKETAELNGSEYKPGERKYYHFKYTVHPEDYSPDGPQKITPQELLLETEKFVYDNFPGYQAVITIQYHDNEKGTNEEHLHGHIVLNSFSYEDKNMLRVENKDLDRMRDYAYEAGLKYNLSERNWREEAAEKKAQKAAEKIRKRPEKINITEGEQKIIDQHGKHFADHSFKEKYRVAIDEAKQETTNREAFCEYLSKHFQMQTKITKQNTILYKMPGRQHYSSGRTLGIDYELHAIDAALKNSQKQSDLASLYFQAEWGQEKERLRELMNHQRAEQGPREDRASAEIRANRSAMTDTVEIYQKILSVAKQNAYDTDNLQYLKNELEQQERQIRAEQRAGNPVNDMLQNQERMRRAYLSALITTGDNLTKKVQTANAGQDNDEKMGAGKAIEIAKELGVHNIAEMELRVANECSKIERDVRELYKSGKPSAQIHDMATLSRIRQRELKAALDLVRSVDLTQYETEPEMKPAEKKKNIEWIQERRDRNNEKAEETFAKAERLVAETLRANGERYSKDEFKDLNYLIKQTSYLESNLQTELDKLDRLLERWEASKDPSLSEEERRQHNGYVKWCGCDPNSELVFADLKAEREVIVVQQQNATVMREALVNTAQRWRNANELSYAESNLEWTKDRKRQLRQQLSHVKANRKKLWDIYCNCQKVACRKFIGTAEWERVKYFKELWSEKVGQEIEISRKIKEIKKQQKEAKAKVREAEKAGHDLPPVEPVVLAVAPVVEPVASVDRGEREREKIKQNTELREWSDRAVAVVSNYSFYGGENDLKVWAEEMEKYGCKVRITANTVSLTHPESKQSIRTNRLGKGYERGEIIDAIQARRLSAEVIETKREDPAQETISQTVPTYDFRELIQAQTGWLKLARSDRTSAIENPYEKKAEQLKVAIEEFKQARDNELAASDAVRRAVWNRSSKKEELENAREKCREAFSVLRSFGVVGAHDGEPLTGDKTNDEQFQAILYSANAVLGRLGEQATIEGKRRQGQSLEHQRDLAEAKRRFEELCRTVPTEQRVEAENALKEARGDVAPKIDLELKLIYREISKNTKEKIIDAMRGDL